MSYLSEAHAEWHTVHGKYAVCPLDCGAVESLYEPEEEHRIRCAHCKGQHATVAEVRACSTFGNRPSPTRGLLSRRPL